MEGTEEIKIETCEGVYTPAEDSYLMMKHLTPGKSVLEIGSGSGIISVYCALRGSTVEAVDINTLAVECTKKNAELNNVEIDSYQSDLFSEVPKGNKFSTIIFNPPYLPTCDNISGSEQWDGGADGFRVTRRFLQEAPDHLDDGGNIFVILSSLTDIAALNEEFKHLKFEAVGKESFFFEKIFVWRITV